MLLKFWPRLQEMATSAIGEKIKKKREEYHAASHPMKG
jgi:hypothetical protein